jgi:DNA-binding MarR family transcriptional regulator
MTDISFQGVSDRHKLRSNGSGPSTNGARQDAPDPCHREELVAYAELLFFAYRDFTSDPDAALEQYGFGRAHHRVLHFVHRHPGLRVANLLDILKITKQSLARVLKQLIDKGFVLQKAGNADRRERRLFVTAKGGRLIEKLTSLQVKRIEEALATAGPGARQFTRRFLFAMITQSDRARVETLIKLPPGTNSDDWSAGGK